MKKEFVIVGSALVLVCISFYFLSDYLKITGNPSLRMGKMDYTVYESQTTLAPEKTVDVDAVLMGIRWVESKCGHDSVFISENKDPSNGGLANNLLTHEYGEFQIKYDPAIVQLKQNYDAGSYTEADPPRRLVGIDKNFAESCAPRISSTLPGRNLKRYQINNQCARAYLVYLLETHNYDLDVAIHDGWNPNPNFAKMVYGAMTLNGFSETSCNTLWKGYLIKKVPENAGLNGKQDAEKYNVEMDDLFLPAQT